MPFKEWVNTSAPNITGTQQYEWVDLVTIIDESQGRRVIEQRKPSDMIEPWWTVTHTDTTGNCTIEDKKPGTKQVIVIRKDLNMRKGKMVAQGAHASMAFITRKLNYLHSNKSPDDVNTFQCELTHEEMRWIDSSFTKVCVSAKSEEELELIAQTAESAGLTVHRIIDNGLTEFNGEKTFTCIAIGPHEESKFTGVTDQLPLL